jgi:hypothetical protein
MARQDIAISGGPDRWSRRDTIRARAKRMYGDGTRCARCGVGESLPEPRIVCADCYKAIHDDVHPEPVDSRDVFVARPANVRNVARLKS